MSNREQSLVTLEYLVVINGITAAGFNNIADTIYYYENAKTNWTNKGKVRLFYWFPEENNFVEASDSIISQLKEMQ